MGRTPSPAVVPWLPGFHMVIYDLALSFGGFELPLALLAHRQCVLGRSRSRSSPASSAPDTVSPWHETLHFWWFKLFFPLPQKLT